MKRRRLIIWLLFGLVPAIGFTQEILTLEKAITTGLANNYSILLQKNAASIARNNNTPGNAGFLPSVTLNTLQNNSVNTTHQEQFSGAVKDIDNAKSSSLNLGVQVNWTVFDGMSMFVNRKMLGTMEQLGENGTRLVMEGFVADATILYYGIVQTKKLVRVAREALDLSTQRKVIAEAKLKIGSGSQLMLMQSTVDRNADSTRLLQQMTTLANLKVDFNRLIGRDPLTAFEVADTIIITGIPSGDSVFRLAGMQNTQLMAARMQTDLARYGIREAQSDRYPRVNLTGGYSYSASSSQTGFLKEGQSYGPSYGFTLTYNLFNGFNVTRTIRNARILMNSTELELEETELMVRGILAKLMNEYYTNESIIALQKVNVGVARENVGIAFEKYRIGSLNDLELREIQRKLIEADYQNILAQFEALKNEIEIAKYCGELLKNFRSN
jgi:outer membrane protein TolC